jgi:hypothetical protein
MHDHPYVSEFLEVKRYRASEDEPHALQDIEGVPSPFAEAMSRGMFLAQVQLSASG